MKNIFILAVLSLMVACTSSSNTSNTATTDSSNVIYEILEPNAFIAKMETITTIQLVDVRTPEEFANGAVGNAVNFNFYDANFKTQIETLDKSKPIFLYCAKGGRSGKASDICKNVGFKEIYDMEGGYTAYSLK